MNLFEQVKGEVTARQVAEYYGIHVRRNGMVCCPFHDDKHPSMKIDKYYYCFACGVGGDCIDFVARMFGLSQYEAAVKVVEDFRLDVEIQKKSGGFKPKKKEQKIVDVRKRFEQWIDTATDILIRYLKWIQFWKRCYVPKPEEEWHELFIEALENERKINDYLNILMFGSGEEMSEFYTKKRREVSRIAKRIDEYQRGILAGFREDDERRDTLCIGC